MIRLRSSLVVSMALVYVGCANPADNEFKVTATAAKPVPDAASTTPTATPTATPTPSVAAHAGALSISPETSKIEFVGSKVTGSHEGGFKSLTGVADVDAKDLTTLKISIDIDMESLFSDNPKLTNHLKSPDFFGVKSNPKSKFVSTKVEKAGDDYKITGNLTMLGQTKPLTIPAKIAATGESLTVTSSFSLDRTQWGMTYGKGKIDDNVKMTISVKATK